jgi:hypothetical protein
VPPDLTIAWDPRQEEVIKAPPAARLLVDAGPGTGKTAVACARLAHLIDVHDLQATRIWLISFTRTAVRELRDRLAEMLEHREDAWGVRVATLDSHAWAMHVGFNSKAALTGSYDENIQEVTSLVQKDAEVAEYLETLEHVIIDEAQDIVGDRAKLILGIISHLAPQCGVTVFTDEAQAIYGFADDKDIAHVAGKRPLPLTHRLRSGTKRIAPFEPATLSKVFRTDRPNLITLFTDTRSKLLANSLEGSRRLADVRRDIETIADGAVPVDEEHLSRTSELFVLFRRRAEVLLKSSFLTGKGIRHRLRLSGLPTCIEPWVGACLSEYTEALLPAQTFLELWTRHVSGGACEVLSADEAWALLVRYSGRSDQLVDMRGLRTVLGRSQPPAEFCIAQPGTGGPIIGTIHAAKGREARAVHLMLPDMPSRDCDFDEEARVVFVGATRAMQELRVGRGFGLFASSVGSGRAFSPHRKFRDKAQVEFGRDGDVLAEGAASRALYAAPSRVRAAQQSLLKLTTCALPARARWERDAAPVAYRLLPNDSDLPVGALASSVSRDLFEIAEWVQERAGGGKRRPPDEIRYLNLIGVRTAVLLPDAPEAGRLHQPWAASGIMLVPILTGYSRVHFPFRRRGR